MSETRDALYSRGKYWLDWDRRKDGSLRSPFLQIFWYDPEAGRNRSRTTGTEDLEAAEDELDKLFLKRERGQAICPACGQPTRQGGNYLLTDSIADYLVARAGLGSIGTVKARLGHVTAFIAATGQQDVTCEAVKDDWVEEFRDWAMEIPVVSPAGNVRDRSPGTVEGSVRQLAAAINFSFNRHDTIFPAAFKVKKPKDVSKTPTHRSSVEELAAMFRYAMKPGRDGKPMAARGPLLRFLQVSVITWARPDAAHDFSTAHARRQWHSAIRVVDLNPKGRTQTRKYRPAVPVGERAAALFDNCTGFYVGVDSVKHSMATMLTDLGLPRDGETGMKLIRRSMSTLVRRRIGEENFVQIERMLGHRKESTSDLYALFEPGFLGRALGATNAIIDEIEALAPGAFAKPTMLKIIEGARRA
jgi:hypothetical protein